MSYNREDLEEIIRISCSELISEQPMLFNQAHDINERTVSCGLSSKIRNHINGFHINCEYNRMIDEEGIQIPKRINLDPEDPQPSRVFPDIIFHRQEDGVHNLLVVEIKMSWKNGERNRDIEKLHGYIRNLNYQFGLYLEFGEDGIVEMQWFS